MYFLLYGYFLFRISSVISKLKTFQESTNDLCHYVMYVPLYKKYCINVELNGKLDVDYVFTSRLLKHELIFF